MNTSSTENTKKGILISFDGVDSSGKETQTKALAERLRAKGHVVHTFVTPDYDLPSGQELKKRLQNKIGDWASTPWEEKNGFFANNRAEHREEVLDALAKGEIVIYDRYLPSSLTFMAIEARIQGTDLSSEEVQEIVAKKEYEENQMPVEDVSIFLDVPPKKAHDLLVERKSIQNDEDEYTDAMSVQEKLYSEYDKLFDGTIDRYYRVQCVESDKLLSVEDISNKIWDELAERFPLLKDQHA